MSARAVRLAAGFAAALAVVAWLGLDRGGTPRRVEIAAPGASLPPASAAAGELASAMPGPSETSAAAPVEDGVAARETVATPPVRPMEKPRVIAVGPLRATAPFHGRVLDGRGGAPIAGASIRLGATREDPTSAPRTVSDEHGRFEVEVGTGGITEVRVDARGYGAVDVAAGPGFEDPARPADVPLERAASLEIRVTAGGAPLAGAIVDVGFDDPLRGGRASRDLLSTTDTAGRARFESVPTSRPLAIGIRDRERSIGLAERPLGPGERRELEIALDARAAIVGRVRERDGTAVAGVRIRVERWSPFGMAILDAATETFQFSGNVSGGRVRVGGTRDEELAISDAEGRFELRDVAPGRWHVGPLRTLPDGSISPYVGLATSIEVRPDAAAPLEVELVVDRGQLVRGRVRGREGIQVDGRVQASVPGDLRWLAAFATADREGTFEIGPLPAGRWALRAIPNSRLASASEPVLVEAGTDGVVLTLGEPLAMVRAILVDRRSNQRREGEVALARPESRSLSFGEVGLEGVALSGPDRGAVAILGRTGDLLFGIARLEEMPAGLATVEIELVPGARLALRNEAREPVEYLVIGDDGLPLASGELAPGVRDRVVVPAGALTVRWREPSSGAEDRSRTSLAAGEERELAWRGR
jgi:hypothetical protein